MKNVDLEKHVMGRSVFLDDYPTIDGTLEGVLFYSTNAHAKIRAIDYKDCYDCPDEIHVINCDYIFGLNQIGGIIQDEPLFASSEVHYIGQPIAIVLASSRAIAIEARERIRITYDDLDVITDPKEAFRKGELIAPPRTLDGGDVEKAFRESKYIFEGTVSSGAQEHLYLETHCAYAYECDGQLKIISSTQNPSAVQRVAAQVLDIPANRIEVEVLRLGGAFGGKEDQATSFAVMCALAAYELKKPVKLIIPRHEDILITGKRHPYVTDYKIGLNEDGKILAFEATYFQNSGAAADLSTAILDRTLFHAANSYFIPNVKVTGYCCRTNLPPNTAFRGFGGPQGMFVIEAALHKASIEMGIPRYVLQAKNLLQEAGKFYYGQPAKNCNALPCWNELLSKVDIPKLENDINKFNKKNKFYKKGFALMPICFGISFTNTFLNQANALVNIYTDGTVNISSAAVEMGQGVNMKLRQVAQKIFSINIDNIRIESTNTSRAANGSPTAASTGADLNGKAVEAACKTIIERLLKFARKQLNLKRDDKIEINDGYLVVNGKSSGMEWVELIQLAYRNRISLSAQSHYATPGLDKTNPFAYHVYGSALITVTVDCLRGTYDIDLVKAVHDFGKSMNKAIDRSQAEGAIMQGIGWMTIEDIVYSEEGELKSNSLSTYKVPDVYFTPKVIDIDFFESKTQAPGIFNSKAIGEPPFMYGIAVYFAILNAMRAFKQKDYEISAPITHEKLLMNLYSGS